MQLYICNGHHICCNSGCEHKWTHYPSHIKSWRNPCDNGDSYCWIAVVADDGTAYEVGTHCVEYKDGILNSFLTEDDYSYDALVEAFGKDNVIERDYDEDEDEELDEDYDLEMPPDFEVEERQANIAPRYQYAELEEIAELPREVPRPELGLRFEDLEELHRAAQRVRFDPMPNWVVEEADYNNANGLAIGRFVRGGGDN